MGFKDLESMKCSGFGSKLENPEYFIDGIKNDLELRKKIILKYKEYYKLREKPKNKYGFFGFYIHINPSFNKLDSYEK